MNRRARTIKPEILEDEKTAELPDDAWRLFVSMIVLSDDAGNMRAKPRTLAFQAFHASNPDGRDIAGMLLQLQDAGLVRLYHVRSQAYAHINGWKKHQHIHTPRPDCPGPETADERNTSAQVELLPTCDPNFKALHSAAPLDGKGLDGIGQEGIGETRTRRRATPERAHSQSKASHGLFEQLLRQLQAAWQERFGSSYTPTSKDKAQLGRLLGSTDPATAELIAERFRRYLSDADPFLTRVGYSVAFFCTNGMNKYALPAGKGTKDVRIGHVRAETQVHDKEGDVDL